MSDIPAFPYELLWGERVVRSVANLTRRDGEDFLALAPRIPVRTEVETYPLEDANLALERLRAGEVRGAAVIDVADPGPAEPPSRLHLAPAGERPTERDLVRVLEIAADREAAREGSRGPGRAADRRGTRRSPRPSCSGSLRGRPRRCRFARRGGGARRSEGAPARRRRAATARRRGRGRGRDSCVRSTERRSTGCSTTQTSEWSRRASRQIEHVSSSVRLPHSAKRTRLDLLDRAGEVQRLGFRPLEQVKRESLSRSRPNAGKPCQLRDEVLDRRREHGSRLAADDGRGHGRFRRPGAQTRRPLGLGRRRQSLRQGLQERQRELRLRLEQAPERAPVEREAANGRGRLHAGGPLAVRT